MIAVQPYVQCSQTESNHMHTMGKKKEYTVAKRSSK